MGKRRGRIAQDLIGSLQLSIPALRLLDPLTIGQTSVAARIGRGFRFQPPRLHRLCSAADIPGNQLDRHPAGGLLANVPLEQAHRSLPDLY